MARPRTAVTTALVLLFAGAPACAFLARDKPAAVPVDLTATTVPSDTTTIPPVPAECGLITQADLDAAGIVAGIDVGVDADAFYTMGAGMIDATCQWSVSTPAGLTFTLTLAIADGANSSVFEELAADPLAGDPDVISDLGDQAVYWRQAGGVTASLGSNYLVVLDGASIMRLESLAATVIDEDQLIALGRAVLSRT